MRLWVKVPEIPRPALYTAILVFATLGVYSILGSVVGLLGFAMRRYDFPIAPVVLGVILGSLAESQMRRTLLVSDCDWSAFVERPFAAAVLACVIPCSRA
jgi:putative tricarboxylic transport membrane protein